SEGFATYFTSLFIEHAYGKEKFVATMKDSRNKVYDFYKNNPDYRIVHDNLADMAKVTTIQTYQKGAWILHMLRQKIGEQAFQKGIQSYYKKYFNGNAVTSDFIREMETASQIDLDEFFKQWLYQGGNIELKGNWKYDSRKKKIIMSLAQVQRNYRFKFPLEVAIYEGSGEPRIERVEMDDLNKTFEIDVATKPERIELDPNTNLLATWDFKGK
ncbi:MAG TPA: M1 family aminopeptidase, partial [Cyclobacteriaceae bacterium]|nr:M1 family aminopeptidase [Cyclobacteriaceae bacterium]